MAVPQPVSLTWNGFVQQIANLAVVETTTNGNITVGVDAPFNTLLPQACSYSELRIQRDVDLQPLLTSNSYALTPANNLLSIPTSDFVTIQTVGVTVNGALTPLLPVSKEFIQNVYGDPSVTAQPQYFAMTGGDAATAGQTSNNIIVGPYPDLNYPVQIMGTVRMPSLYQNATQALAGSGLTFISTWLPDLLIQAAMIPIMQFQRNIGPQSNDPEMPGSFEFQYQQLLKGAIVEEARKRFSAGAWSSMGPTPIATAGR